MHTHYFTTKLTTGRHVAISVQPYIRAVTTGTDTSMYFAVTTIRLHAPQPEKLCGYLAVGCLDELESTGAEPIWRDSSYGVDDILEGKTDWTSSEVEEFRSLIDSGNFQSWLKDADIELDTAIKDSPLWQTELMHIGEEVDSSACMRVLVSKAAMESNGMVGLRKRNIDNGGRES